MTEPEGDLNEVFTEVEALELRTVAEGVENEQVDQTIEYIRALLRDDPTLAGEVIEGDRTQDAGTGIIIALMEATGRNQQAILELLHGQARLATYQRERDGRVDRLAAAIEALTSVVQRLERRRRGVFFGQRSDDDGPTEDS
jgi:hypothetical protein